MIQRCPGLEQWGYWVGVPECCCSHTEGSVPGTFQSRPVTTQDSLHKCQSWTPPWTIIRNPTTNQYLPLWDRLNLSNLTWTSAHHTYKRTPDFLARMHNHMLYSTRVSPGSALSPLLTQTHPIKKNAQLFLKNFCSTIESIPASYCSYHCTALLLYFSGQEACALTVGWEKHVLSQLSTCWNVQWG